MKVTTVEVKSKTILRKNNENTRKLPISIMTLFLTLLFVGYDFGFINVLKKKIRRFCYYYSRLISFVAIITLGLPLVNSNSANFVFGTMNFLHLVGHVISLHIAKYKVYHYVTDIRAIDSNVRANENFGVVCACVGCLFLCAFRLVGTWIIYLTNDEGYRIPDNLLLPIFYSVFMTCEETTPVIQMLVYYYAYCAVKYLKHLLDNPKSDVNEIRKQYTYIADCCDKIRPLYGHLFLADLLINVPKLLFLIINTLYSVKLQAAWAVYITHVFYTSIIIVQLCCPATMIEVVNKQVKGVRLMLYTRLLNEKDTEKNLEIANLLSYMKERPMNDKVCFVFPVDIKLVVALFSFISTYLIVIIQFSHIYDI